MPLEPEVLVDPEVEFDNPVLIDAVLRFASTIFPAGPTGAWTMVVRITDDDEIARLHDQYFSDPSPTDVISFPSGDDLGGDSGHLGDVVISVDTAERQGADEGNTATREVAFLALHGLLHLCGYTDTTPEDRQRMLDIQIDLLSSFEARHGSIA